MKKLTLCLLSGLLLGPVSGLAQRGYELGVWLGGTHYFGDLNTSYALNRPGPAGGVVGRYNFNDRISIKLGAGYGILQARDSDSDNPFQQARNLSFRTGIIDASLQFEFNFFRYIHGSRDAYFTPYLLLGAGVCYFNPKAQLDGSWIALQPLGTEGQPVGGEYTLVQPALAYGLGFKIDLSYEWSLNFEISGRALFSDYLDDVSTTYPNMLELQNLRGPVAVRLSDRSAEVAPEPIGEPGRQRGSSNDNDSYGFLSVSLVYYFGSVLCPAISKPHRAN